MYYRFVSLKVKSQLLLEDAFTEGQDLPPNALSPHLIVIFYFFYYLYIFFYLKQFSNFVSPPQKKITIKITRQT